MAIEQIQVRRDTAANWALANPVLGSGEPAYETDTGVLKVGNGVALYTDLPTYASFTPNGALPAAVTAALQTLFDSRYVLPAKVPFYQQQASAKVVTYLSPDGTYEYEVVTVRAPNNSMSTAIEKIYTNDYEKTWTGGTFSPSAQAFANFQTQSNAYIILSCDAFQGGQMAGLQIKNGAVYRGWGNYSNDPRIGQEAIALMSDGTWRTFTSATNPDPNSVVAAGAQTTWGFGPLVVINGAARSNIGDSSIWADWVTSLSARHLFGYNAAGDMVSIIVKGKTGTTGIAGVEMANVALRHGCVNAIMLDGGGSVQGQSTYLFHPSTDTGGNRDVWNAIAVKVPTITPIRTTEVPIAYSSGFSGTNGQFMTARKVDGETRLRGPVFAASIAANTWYTVGYLPPRFWPIGTDSYRNGVFTSANGYSGVVSIASSDGSIQLKSPVAGTNSYWQLDGIRFDAVY